MRVIKFAKARGVGIGFDQRPDDVDPTFVFLHRVWSVIAVLCCVLLSVMSISSQ